MSKTFASASVYPLAWPDNFPRYRSPGSSQFNTSLYQALDNVNNSLRLFAENSGKKLSDIVISSNYSLSDPKPKDSGVAVYFTWDGERTCIPVDKYALVQDNLQAIHHCIDAERTKLRHGGISLVKAAFRGYAALPDPNKLNWRDILDYPEGNDISAVKKKYQDLMRINHPDKNLNNIDHANEQTALINSAWAQAKAELQQ